MTQTANKNLKRFLTASTLAVLLLFAPVISSAQEGGLTVRESFTDQLADGRTRVTYIYEYNGELETNADGSPAWDYYVLCENGGTLENIAPGRTSTTFDAVSTSGTFTCFYAAGVTVFSAYAEIHENNDANAVIARAQSEGNLGEEVDPAQSWGIGDAIDKGFGGPIGLLINTIVGIVMVIIDGVLWLILTQLAIPLIDAMLSLRVTDLMPIVERGWTTIRNVTNMFFILALIVIGLATILRLESYNYKRLLGWLVLMALLVNFSLVICQAIITVADVVTEQFITVQSTDGKSLVTRVIFDRINALEGYRLIEAWESFANSPTPFLSQASNLVGTLFYLSMKFLMVVVFVAVAVYLVIRMVALWILMIFSPFVYFAFVLPPLRGIATTWWRAFLKYAFYAPIVAFFFYLITQLAIPDLSTSVGTADSLTGVIRQNAELVIIIAMLWASLIVASKLSIMGSNAAMGFAQKAAVLPFAATGAAVGAGIGAAGKTYTKKTAQYAREAAEAKRPGRAAAWAAASFLNPKAAKMAWKQRSERIERETYGTATAEMHDTLNKYMPTELKWKNGRPSLGKTTFYGTIAQQAEVGKAEREIAAAGFDEVDTAKAAANAWEKGNEYEVEAWTKYLIATNRTDDLKNYLDQNPNAHQLAGLDKVGKGFDSFDFERLLQSVLEDRFGADKAKAIGSNLHEYAEEVAKPRHFGMMVTDEKTGEKRWSENPEEKVKETLMRMNRADMEKMAGALEPGVFQRIVDGKIADFGKAGELLFKRLNPALVGGFEKTRRYQPRVLGNVGLFSDDRQEIDDGTGKKVANPDYGRVTPEVIDYKKMAKAISLQSDMVKVSIGKTEFSNAQKEMIEQRLRPELEKYGITDFKIPRKTEGKADSKPESSPIINPYTKQPFTEGEGSTISRERQARSFEENLQSAIEREQGITSADHHAIVQEVVGAIKEGRMSAREAQERLTTGGIDAAKSEGIADKIAKEFANEHSKAGGETFRTYSEKNAGVDSKILSNAIKEGLKSGLKSGLKLNSSEIDVRIQEEITKATSK